jgi:hypothetical protein
MRINDIMIENALANFVAQDQKERNEYQHFVKTDANGDWETGAKLYAKSKNRSEDDIFGDRDRLNQFTKMKFDFSKFTAKDWNNYWILAQHADYDRNFQKQALAIIKQYLGEDSEEFKYLYDRISCGLDGKQKFGTQDICDIDD